MSWSPDVSITEWLSRTSRRSSEVTNEEIVAALDEARGPWPNAAHLT